ncbi:MAG: hypothetical protein CBD16_02580 [Betaproteobacteria bacterium TMED156]|nr:MAG: hypothetical protein CBD16_02580 [Betaproteobacteria bacterium TMED156]
MFKNSEKTAEIIFILGIIVSLFSLFFSVPIVISLIYGEDVHKIFFVIGIITLLIGTSVSFIFRNKQNIKSSKKELQPRDGFLLVVLVWMVLSFVSSLPFYFQFEKISFIASVFEAISGLTTTGATVFDGLDHMSKGILIWRALLQWIGGMGILVLTIAILPLLGVGGMQVFRAEASGPMKDKKLTPRIAETAKALWVIYLVLTSICAFFYWLAGMSFFDATAHAFTTVSIGGLSTHDESIGFFNNSAIEFTAIFFMILAGMNFTLHFSVIRNLSFKMYWKSIENKCFLSILFLGIVFVFLTLLTMDQNIGTFDYLRIVSFNVISIATTTGYATQDYGQWPPVAFSVMLLLSCFTTCSGSTGGGVKMIRIIIMFKQAGRELSRLMHPHAIIPINIGELLIANKVVMAILAFMFFYIVTLLVTFFLLMFSGLNPGTSLSASIACLNNLGPALFELGPTSNYGILNDFQLSILATAMLLGRLELLTIFIFFSGVFWKK